MNVDAGDLTLLIGEQAIAIRVQQEDIREKDAKINELKIALLTAEGQIEAVDQEQANLMIEVTTLKAKVERLQNAKKTRRRGK